MLSACVPGGADPPPPDPNPSPPGVSPTLGTIPEGTDTEVAPLTEDDVVRAIAAIEQALLVFGLQSTVTYDEDTEQFLVIAEGNFPFDNAKLAERIIRIVGDSDQPDSIMLTHSQLKVRIRPDPDSDQQCNCALQ